MKTVVPIVLGALLASGCASGGRYLGPRPYPGPLGEVIAGNLALTCPGSVYLGPPINRCAEHVLIGGQPY